MVKQENDLSNKLVKNSILKVHIIAITLVCIAFGLINIFTGSVAIGIIIAAAGIATAAVMFAIRNSAGKLTRGIIMTLVQIAIIIVMSVLKHELHGMFPLMLASMAIAAVYYSRLNLILHWVVMDAASIAGLFFKSFFYSDAGMEFIIKGILGINIGAFLILYLMNCSLGYIKETENANSESDGLLVQVQDQMRNSKKILERQKSVVTRVAEASRRVNHTSGRMLEISEKINENAEEQKQSIYDISKDIDRISEETQNAIEESSNAAVAASESTNLVKQSNAEMQNMLSAMAEITDSSHKIESIIKTIDDIAFQTNILALNAAVEASRAGAAGKGFAVVADEVKNLSYKSSEAVKNTSKLIKSSIESVKKGTAIAEETADILVNVLQSAENSAEHARLIAELTSSQMESIGSVRERIQQVTKQIDRSSRTSVESAELARTVAEESQNMDKITKEFRS